MAAGGHSQVTRSMCKPLHQGKGFGFEYHLLLTPRSQDGRNCMSRVTVGDTSQMSIASIRTLPSSVEDLLISSCKTVCLAILTVSLIFHRVDTCISVGWTCPFPLPLVNATSSLADLVLPCSNFWYEWGCQSWSHEPGLPFKWSHCFSNRDWCEGLAQDSNSG